MNSSFGTIAARRRLPHFRHSLVSEPAANQPSTSRSEELEISTTTGWGELKQPDNQEQATEPLRAASGSAARALVAYRSGIAAVLAGGWFWGATRPSEFPISVADAARLFSPRMAAALDWAP